jgi:hypothetical protein
MEESAVRDVYDLVYEAHRPELFLKGRGRPAHGGARRADRDPRRLDVERPEPEIRVVVGRAAAESLPNTIRQRRVVARDRGTNPLYLSQAKVYAAACYDRPRYSTSLRVSPQGFQHPSWAGISDEEARVLCTTDKTSTTPDGADVPRS